MSINILLCRLFGHKFKIFGVSGHSTKYEIICTRCWETLAKGEDKKIRSMRGEKL